jgi:hypothetical protein
LIKQNLTDLDELILSCRSDAARTYLGEAVACYNAGAYRSCIVATWIAVLFDYLHKLHELSIYGDARAKERLKNFEAARQANDVKASLEFERKVLEDAAKEFELIGPIEMQDLERLLQDRNRCAHPSMISEEEIYTPSAETARAHMKAAVNHLLQHVPVQGKAALQKIWNDFHSPLFPSDLKEALQFLREGPLNRAKPSVVREVVAGFTTDLLKEKREVTERRRQFAGLNAVLVMYPAIGQAMLKEKLPKTLSSLDEKDFPYVISFLANVEPAWSLIGYSEQIKAKNFVEKSSISLVGSTLANAVRVPALKEFAEKRTLEVDSPTLSKIIQRDPSAKYVDLAVSKFEKPGSFRMAEWTLESLVVPLASVIDAKAMGRIAEAFLNEGQVWPAGSVPDLLMRLLATMPNPEDSKSQWEKIFQKLSTDEYFTKHSTRGDNLRIALKERFPDFVPQVQIKNQSEIPLTDEEIDFHSTSIEE